MGSRWEVMLYFRVNIVHARELLAEQELYTYLMPVSERALPYMGCCLSRSRLLVHACDVLISFTRDVARGSERGKLKRLTNGPNYKRTTICKWREHFKMNGGIKLASNVALKNLKVMIDNLVADACQSI